MTQNDFVKYLEQEEISIFEIQILKQILDLDNRTINEIVENLVVKDFYPELSAENIVVPIFGTKM